MTSLNWVKGESTVDFREAVTADAGLKGRATESRETKTRERGRRRSHETRASGRARIWGSLLDLAYVAWVVRVPLIALFVGVMLMYSAPQAQDLLVDLVQSLRLASFLLLVAVWVAVTTYASFLLLGTDRRLLDHSLALKSSDGVAYRRLERFRTAMPYVLGTLPFVIVFVAAIRSLYNLPDIEDDVTLSGAQWALWRSIGYTFALIVLFGYLSFTRPKAVCGLLDKAEAAVKRLNDKMPKWMPKWLTFGILAAGPNPAVRTRHYLGPVVLFAVFAASAIIFVFGPNAVADWLPRALIIPVVLGGWLPLLTLLSAFGRRWRAPLISGSLLVLAILSAAVGDNHSVRRVNTADSAPQVKTAGPAAPLKLYSTMKLNNAVDLWMEENGCKADPSQCPRPIIVAGAGGASRAGFFTASVIGRLMDNAQENVSMDAAAVRNRIFAISGVSGGAVGAVMTVAAMARAGDETRQPCTNGKPTLWYGDTIGKWQDCLEALTAGDFLTPVVLGLIFNDRIDFGLWQDRAAVLEQSWENRFADLTRAAAYPTWKDKCPGDLRCPFMMLRPEPGRWLPLLVLNGTSATTGRRIVTSILETQYGAQDCPTRAPTQSKKDLEKQAELIRGRVPQDRPAFELAGASGEQDECLLFLESTRFHELLASKRKAGLWERVMSRLGGFDTDKVMDDVTLSTAAHNSARFPLISPPGAVRNRQNQVIDRIVDGGYVDNYGALTALELAQAIHAIEPRLAPFVLTVSNDPDEDPDLYPLDAPDGTFLSDIVIPVETVMNARTGHGRLAKGQVEAVLDHLADPACGAQTAHVRVWPQFAKKDGDIKESRPVSMSWWLSKPIQIHLHQQTEGTRNQNQNHAEVEKTWTALDKPPGCVGRKVAPSAVEEQQRAKVK
jgi:hypothetical protein